MEADKVFDQNHRLKGLREVFIFGSWKTRNRPKSGSKKTGIVEPIVIEDKKSSFIMSPTQISEQSNTDRNSTNHYSIYNCDYEYTSEYNEDNVFSRYDQLDEYYWCPRCGGKMHEPRLLPCLHTVCYSCVKEFMNQDSTNFDEALPDVKCDNSKRGGSKVELCPICDYPLPKSGASIPPPHYSLQQRLLLYALQKRLSYRTVCCDTCPNEVQATLHCSKCLCNFCVDCGMEHEEVQVRFRSNLDCHKVKPIWEATKLRRVALCLAHPTHPLRFHCIACQQATCRECIWKGEHKGHASEDAASASKRAILQLTEALKSAKILLSSLLIKYNDKIFTSNTISRSHTIRSKGERNFPNENSQIAHFRSYSAISSHSKEARERIEEFSRLKKARYLIDAVALCEDLLSNCSDIEILSLSQIILKRLKSLGVPVENYKNSESFKKGKKHCLKPLHFGIFHCCTFCSSGGKKEVTCACNGKMPGGYKGCGHGHPGHPGLPHWSCCGSVSREGYCLAVRKCSYQMTL